MKKKRALLILLCLSFLFSGCTITESPQPSLDDNNKPTYSTSLSSEYRLVIDGEDATHLCTVPIVRSLYSAEVPALCIFQALGAEIKRTESRVSILLQGEEVIVFDLTDPRLFGVEDGFHYVKRAVVDDEIIVDFRTMGRLLSAFFDYDCLAFGTTIYVGSINQDGAMPTCDIYPMPKTTVSNSGAYRLIVNGEDITTKCRMEIQPAPNNVHLPILTIIEALYWSEGMPTNTYHIEAENRVVMQEVWTQGVDECFSLDLSRDDFGYPIWPEIKDPARIRGKNEFLLDFDTVKEILRNHLPRFAADCRIEGPYIYVDIVMTKN